MRRGSDVSSAASQTSVWLLQAALSSGHPLIGEFLYTMSEVYIP